MNITLISLEISFKSVSIRRCLLGQPAEQLKLHFKCHKITLKMNVNDNERP